LYMPGLWLIKLYGEAAIYCVILTVLLSAAASLLTGENVWKLTSVAVSSTLIGLAGALLVRLLAPSYVIIVGI